MKLPTIALVGRPNVGKSTIFNRLVGRKQAIIEDTPGVTRDRIYGTASYLDYKFNVIDTGGIDIGEDAFNKEIKMQAELAIDEADVVVFIVDGKEGMTTNDLVVRDILRRSNKKVVVAINKVDNKKTMENIYDFYELGFDYYIPISGSHNIGMNDLLDEVTSGFKKQIEEEYSSDVVKFCVYGGALRSALGIAIYGMFLAVILPPAREHRSIRAAVLIAAIISCLCYYLPVLNRLSSGFVIILPAFPSPRPR